MSADLVRRWDDALALVRAHGHRCTCESCVDARGFLERMKQLIKDVWPADGNRSRVTE